MGRTQFGTGTRVSPTWRTPRWGAWQNNVLPSTARLFVLPYSSLTLFHSNRQTGFFILWAEILAKDAYGWWCFGNAHWRDCAVWLRGRRRVVWRGWQEGQQVLEIVKNRGACGSLGSFSWWERGVRVWMAEGRCLHSMLREVELQTWVSSLGKDTHAFSKIKIELLDRMGLYERGQWISWTKTNTIWQPDGLPNVSCHLRPQNLCTTWSMSVDRERDIEMTKPSRIDLTVIIKWL